MDIQVSLQMV